MNLFSKRSTATLPRSTLSARLLKLKTFLFRMLNIVRPKSTKQWLMAATIFLASLFSPPALAGTSGGRIGGTYSRPSRPSMSRPAAPSRPHRGPLPPKKHYHYPNTYPRYRTSSPIYHRPLGYSTTTIVESPYMREIHPRKVRAGDLVLWTGVGLAVSTGVRRHYEQQHHSRSIDQSPLGPGATAAFMTVALQVPDRTSSFSLLKNLESKAMSANTETRQGLQQTVSEVALELLRKDSSIVSVGTSIRHFGSVREAQVAFQKASIMNRSKLDRESVSNVGGSKTIQRQQGENKKNGDNFFKPMATMAVVTLGLCIEGNSLSTRTPKQLRSRQDVRKALSQIASDAQTEDCLLSAEILWTPEDDSDFLSETDIYADYPDLYPLLD
ncbi:unnamed protein product [Cylindrotheca closterium]|uniref:Uncharacterized protein n=1 Tax=Cylindrotheca closterium TaxID=2856 RepID=A0AAD2JPB4_9STRA|nr:unnamed protein product [Cylindrotheca closterium]